MTKSDNKKSENRSRKSEEKRQKLIEVYLKSKLHGINQKKVIIKKWEKILYLFFEEIAQNIFI